MNISKYLYVTISLVTNFLLKRESNKVFEKVITKVGMKGKTKGIF